MALLNHHRSAISRLFSSSVVRELATRGKSALFTRLAGEANLFRDLARTDSVGDAFEAAFSILKDRAHRDEYVYRAALMHKVLLGTHSLQTASAISEFRVGECKADLVILNGTSTVYEIKSERDSLARLTQQISAYVKIFSRVYVIAAEKHVDAILRSTSPDVGVMALSRRYQISTLREAADRSADICCESLFHSLRTREAQLILEEMGVPVPSTPNTLLHAALKSEFKKLPPQELHQSFVGVLKRTRKLTPLKHLIEDLPPSLTAAALSVPLRKKDHQQLIDAVHTPIHEALAWA